MATTIRTFTAAVMLAAAVVLPDPAPAAAAEAVHRLACGQYRLSEDRVCLMAVRGKQGAFWRVTVHLHVQQHRGHDRVFAAAWVGTGGHVWLERQHTGHTRTLGRKTSRGDGAVSQGQDHAVYDGPGYRARACADARAGRLRACTTWH
ncbi:hypothetical protein [Streptomyces sp. NPDC004286]|uniref:hypothetical protein n=1 Tax=Streptomyces sp. NPDC004286 TaxID=3364696 RepID=UPI003679BC54